ncbi:response regulator transcription factor [Paenibacillus sp. SAFN-117]|uniref:response regulator transcription factor n=1 Tax=Paenibacillus sp. SAFN-117 TaxID=3436860 RepID=UPI001CD966B5|nr:response regulator [Aneurinibacillus sp. XH2]
MMHKVMLIDDDVPMLKVLRQMIDWESLNLHIVGTTYSSAKALHMFKETAPDIVITDIGLPQTNGIELAAAFTRMQPEIRVIFLTCHEDFHYAQSALRLNADDYLLKDQLTAEQLEQSLKKSIRLLKAKATRMDHETSNYNNELFKHGLFQRVIDGVHPETTLGYASQLGISWGYPWFMLGIVHLNYSSYEQLYDQSDLPLILYAIYNIATELSASYEGITPFMEQGHLAVLYNYRLNLANNANQHFHNYLQELRWRCSQFIKVRLSTVAVTDKMLVQSIGPIYQSLIHHKNEFYVGDELTVSEINRFVQNIFLPSPQGFLDPYKPELERVLLKSDIEAVRHIVANIGQAALEQRVEPGEFIRDVSYLLRSIEMMFGNPNSDEAFYFYLSSARTLRDAMDLAVNKLVRIAENRHETGPAVREPKLQVIQQYIDRHLSENITSIDMARYLFLNPSYFSRYFKRLTGINFTDYVHQYKMKIAAKMLVTSSQTLESLAIGLGYSDRTYFSKVFKKYIGMTPSDYKTRHSAGRYAK